jgi:hypothetical protein
LLDDIRTDTAGFGKVTVMGSQEVWYGFRKDRFIHHEPLQVDKSVSALAPWLFA